MRKSIAHITLVVLLAAPVLSWITVFHPVEQKKFEFAFQFGFPGDFEEDESDSGKENETDFNNDFIIEGYSILQLPLGLKQNESQQSRIFREHSPEIGTPPPKR